MLLNVTFGVLAFHPIGWLYILLVIFVEFLVLRKYLQGRVYKFGIKRLILIVFIVNILSGLVGFIPSVLFYVGIIIVWFPWMSVFEISNSITDFFLIYSFMFIITCLVEGFMLGWLLEGNVSRKDSIRASFIINAISYFFGSLVLYFASDIISR